MSDKRKICVLLCSLGALTLLCTMMHTSDIASKVALGAGGVGTAMLDVEQNISSEIGDVNVSGAMGDANISGSIEGNITGAVQGATDVAGAVDGNVSSAVGAVESNISTEALAVQNEMAKVLSFENIIFETNSANITEQSIVSVDKIAKILSENPNVKVEIGGHTDDLGNDKSNQILSQKRVDSVKAKLQDMGIASERMSAVGYGETKPLAENSSDENRAKNRRVEFKIVGE